MPSIIPGYEYDIFISYRQNDNQDGWVTEFVNNLNREIKATFKEDISIYFDENPHDGLHEHHEVDDSLREKLKCLIFIPIVSQTYCDPKCFAWEHEFKVFVEQASSDEFGLKTKLSGGNVASRVLPLKIHDLDNEDQQLFESEVGGVMRSIDFIYTDTGVNRSLSPKDSKDENLNKTRYRDQINKVANAIKELIYGLQHKPFTSSQNQTIETTGHHSSVDDKSVAVLPFVNMSNDPEQEYFSDGLTEEIINILAQVPNLKVVGRTSVFSLKGKSNDLREVGQKLGVSKILEGSVRKSGNLIRITVQLINANDGYHIWSQKFDRELNDIFKIQDEIALTVVNRLKVNLSQVDELNIKKRYTNNPDIVNRYLLAKFYFNKRTQENFDKALAILEKIIKEDVNFVPAYVTIADCYRMNLVGYGTIPREVALKKLKINSNKAFKIDPALDVVHASLSNTSLLIEWNLAKSKEHSEKAIKLNPNNSEAYQWYAWYHLATAEYEKSVTYFKKALELDPLSVVLITETGWPYHYNGDLDTAISYYEKAIEIDPSYALAYYDLGVALFNQGNQTAGLDKISTAINLWGEISFFLSTMGHLSARNGNTKKANVILEKLKGLQQNNVPSTNMPIADVYDGLGDVEAALKWIKRGVDEKEPLALLVGIFRTRFLGSNLLKNNSVLLEIMRKAGIPEVF